jgi:light-regulated signal transduction histidine kinase (bacteriophytochrome)
VYAEGLTPNVIRAAFTGAVREGAAGLDQELAAATFAVHQVVLGAEGERVGRRGAGLQVSRPSIRRHRVDVHLLNPAAKSGTLWSVV